MPDDDRERLSIDNNPMQDNVQVSAEYVKNGELWQQTSHRQAYVAVKGLSVMLGEIGRRRGAGPLARRISQPGTITTVGTAVIGAGTSFTALAQYDWIQPDPRNGEWREIASVTDDANLTLTAPFATDVTVAANFSRLQFVAERMDDLNSRTQNITADPDDTTLASNLLVTDGHGIKYDGSYSAGWTRDGRPTQECQIDISIGVGQTVGSAPHGRANAYNANELWGVEARYKETPYVYSEPITWYYNDTLLYIVRSTSTPARTYQVTFNTRLGTF